jgi:class 3 adenylate cyclase
MQSETAHAKHATVMSADVVGFAAMMAADAMGTLSALLTCFRQVEALVKQFGGRIVDAPGDNMLIEFPNEIGAFLCAVEVQRRLAAAREGGSPMRVRIGVHSGETLEHGGRLYGDPVNIAARLQADAEPDGILISQSVAERAPSQGSLWLDELGPRAYKNIPYSVATYRPRL